MCIVAPTSIAAAFELTKGMARFVRDFDLLRFIFNPPADASGRAELRSLSDS
jgi:hypothetical protein